MYYKTQNQTAELYLGEEPMGKAGHAVLSNLNGYHAKSTGRITLKECDENGGVIPNAKEHTFFANEVFKGL